MDVAAMKKRLATYIAIDVVAIVAAGVGFVGDIAFGVEAMRALWVAGIGAAVAAQVWLVLGMRSGKEN